MSHPHHRTRGLCAWACFLVGYVATYIGVLPGLCWGVQSGEWTLQAAAGVPVIRLYGLLLNGLVLGGLGHGIGWLWRTISPDLYRRCSVITLALALASWLLVLVLETHHWMLPPS